MFKGTSLHSFVSTLQQQNSLEKTAISKYPKITIITPSYNQAAYLERTILSVLNQNYPNLEYMVIDGGSTDGSVEIIKKYEKWLAYWVSEKDHGQVDAINKGLRRATGEWIGFQNSDDVYAPYAFDTVAQTAAQHPQSSIIYGHLLIIDKNDNIIEQLKTVPYSLMAQVVEGMQIHNQSWFFKKELVEKVGVFDERYRFAFDYEVVTRYTFSAQTYPVQAQNLWGALRKHEDTKTSNIAHIGKEEHRQIKQSYLPKIALPLGEKAVLYRTKLNKLLYFLGKADLTYMLYRMKR